MRILTYNIHKGFTTGNRRFALAAMREAIRATDADVVCLQEVQGQHDAHAGKYQDWITEGHWEFLADSVWPHHAYGRNAVYDGGHHGNAILSRWPIDVVENINLTMHNLEQRGIIHAQITPERCTTPVHILCTHLDLSGFTRVEQVLRIQTRMQAHIPDDAPLILAGDFNDWRGQAHRLLRANTKLIEAHEACNGQLARSFPSWLPMLKLDRVYTRGFHLHSAQRLVGGRWSGLSDHCPLVVDLDPIERIDGPT